MLNADGSRFRPIMFQHNLWVHTMITRLTIRCLLAGLCFALLSQAGLLASDEVRIRDLTEIEGVRNNQLVGLGLVTGLNGTGGKSPITRQLAINLIQRFGLRVDPETRDRLRNDTMDKTDNISVVTVTADLPAFARNGQTIDVLVSAFDDAKNLAGGQLIMTSLKAVDGEVYAVASGAISTGGFAFSGDAGGAQKNHPTTGRIPTGQRSRKRPVLQSVRTESSECCCGSRISRPLGGLPQRSMSNTPPQLGQLTPPRSRSKCRSTTSTTSQGSSAWLAI